MSGSEGKPGEQTSPAAPSPNTQTHLAWLRTRMSIENALAAWIRTATSLIGFGFAIVQIFGHINGPPGVLLPKGPHLARYVGLVLIGVGSLSTTIAVWEYRKVVKYLDGEAFRDIAGIPGLRRTYPQPALGVAVIVCLVGLLAFFGILAGAELP